MKIAIATDEPYDIVMPITELICQHGHTSELLTTTTTPWPIASSLVNTAIQQQQCEQGLLLCWTGTGVCMAANKGPNIRAALCTDAETAAGAKRWNNANVLCLSVRLTTITIAEEILQTWFTNCYQANTANDACLHHLGLLEQTG